MKNVDKIIIALENLGGVAHLDDIKEELDKLGYRFDEPRNISMYLERHSSSSKWDEGRPKKDIFYSKYGVEARKGIWGLRSHINKYNSR